MCEGVVPPDISFTEQIPELQGSKIDVDWKSAISEAESAVHIPAKNQIKNRSFLRKTYTAQTAKGEI
jgi:hypothetical protein